MHELVELVARALEGQFGELAIGDIGEGDDAADDAVVAVAEGPGVDEQVSASVIFEKGFGGLDALAETEGGRIGGVWFSVVETESQRAAVFEVEGEEVVEGLEEGVAAAEFTGGAAGADDASAVVADDDGLGGLFEDGPGESFGGEDFVAAFLFGQVGDDDGDGVEGFGLEGTGGDVDGNGGVVGELEDAFGGLGGLGGGAEEGLEGVAVGGPEEGQDGGTDDVLDGQVDHFGEASVGVEDGAVGAEGDGAFGHVFDEDAVGPFGAGEGVDFFAVRGGDDEGVDFSVADGAEGFLGFIGREVGDRDVFFVIGHGRRMLRGSDRERQNENRK